MIVVGINPAGESLHDVHVAGETLQAIWVRGEQVWPLSVAIEDFEDISTYDESFRGTFTGDTEIIADAALATDKGSTQGIRCYGFIEFYSMPGDHDPGLESGREASFFFRPVSFDSSDQWHFIFGLQDSEPSPPDRGYRFEFHMGGGSRITRIDGQGSRTVLDTENNTNWASATYEPTFLIDNSGITMSVSDATLSTTDTTYVDSVMGFGFRASADGTADYDWLGYV